MWRTEDERALSAGERLKLADEVWHWQPHPAQERFFCSVAQVRVAACGRRWGKTESLGIDIASLALAEAKAGRDCRQLIVAPSDVQVRLLGNEVLSKLLSAFDDDAPWTRGLALDVRQRPSLQITVYPAGSDIRAISNDKKAKAKGPASARIIFRTAGRNGASLRGLWAHRIIVDEASRVPDVVMTEVLMPMLMDVGGDYVLASSPFGRRSAFYRLFAKGQGDGVEDHGVSFASFQCPTSDNPHNEPAMLESMRDEMGDAMYAQEIMAEFSDDFGAVFREDDISGCLETNSLVAYVTGDLLSEPQPGRIYSLGIDWGRKQDFTVCAVVDATETPARLVQLQRWSVMGWDAQVASVADTIAKFNPLRVLADGNSIGDPLAETLGRAVRDAQARRGQHDPRGINVERFIFTSDTKLQLVDKLNLGLSRRGLRYPNHKALLNELRGFEYGAVGSSGRARMAAKGAGHDDIVMGLALAWWCAPEGVQASPASLVLLGSSLRR